MILSLLNVLSHGPTETTEEPVGPSEFWGKLAISAFLVLAGGVFAGYPCPLYN